MNKAYILLGGNIGNIAETFKQCIEHISLQVGNCVKLSNIYVSESWGFKSENFFYNQAILLETKKSPKQLLKHLMLIEKLLGRERNPDSAEFMSRPIDIDILFYNDKILESKNLVIPHPLFHLRSFALLPMAEIAPDLVHPVIGETIVQILSDCEDVSYVMNIKQHDSKIILS